MSAMNVYTKLLDQAKVASARNPCLWGIACWGRRAGLDAETIAADIHRELDANDPLTDHEVFHTIDNAFQVVDSGEVSASSRLGYSRPATRIRHLGTNPDKWQQDFFKRMVDAGTEWYSDHAVFPSPSTALYSLSPVQFPPRDWRRQAALHIDVLAQDWLGLVFTGEQDSPRDARHVRQAESVERDILDGTMEIPPQIMANQLTGGKSWRAEGSSGGHWSMATKSEVLHFRHAVVEFDGYSTIGNDGKKTKHPLDVRTCAMFWIGAIITESIPCLRSLVYSGGKSIHAVLRLAEVDDLPLNDPRRHLSPEELWKAQWTELENILCSSPNRLYHLDSSCKDSTRQTRLAGHLRRNDKTGKKCRQALLWLANPDQFDLPK